MLKKWPLSLNLKEKVLICVEVIIYNSEECKKYLIKRNSILLFILLPTKRFLWKEKSLDVNSPKVCLNLKSILEAISLILTSASVPVFLQSRAGKKGALEFVS